MSTASIETKASGLPVNFALSKRQLSSQDIAADSPGDASVVSLLEANVDIGYEALIDDINKPSSELLAQIKAAYADTGAVLLRGLPISDTAKAEKVLSALGVNFDDEYLGGASPRSRLSEHFFTSTEAPAPYVITFHTEMCYLRQRPGKIFFYCITKPSKHGETPVFDTEQIFARLSPELQNKIESLGMIYQRYFVNKKARFFNVYKTWMDSFHAKTREEAEAACKQQGLSYQWQSDGSLVTQAKMPGCLLDPQTGKKCISLTLYNGEAAPYDMSRFSSRLNPIVRFGLSSFIRSQYARKNVFMRTLWGDGSAISTAETREMIDAAWKSSTLFHWQKGDLLILDNIRCGHGRLNVVKPRKIAAALGDPYEVENLNTGKDSDAEAA